ncbi:hypothetical protein Q0S20_26970, partial [Escherichia coli O2:H6]
NVNLRYNDCLNIVGQGHFDFCCIRSSQGIQVQCPDCKWQSNSGNFSCIGTSPINNHSHAF